MMMMHRNNVMHHNKFGVINNNFRNTHNNDGRHRFFKIWDTVFEVEAKYVPKDAIGRGAYGVVCSCVNTLTNEKVAIKKINVVENSNEALKALKELRILGHVRHENVIALKDVMIPSATCKDVYLVFELMDGDLGTFIDSSPPLPNFLIQSFIFQLLNGLNYLHSCNIIHRDLKPGNVLLNNKGRLKICDFGLATTTKGSPEAQPVTENFGTRWYKAPELLLNCFTYGPSIDIWSVGCIFAELLGGEPLFAEKDKLGELIKIMNIVGTPGIGLRSLFPDADPLGLDLLSKMLAFDPTKRITVAEALQHPYINMWSMYYPRTSQPIPFPCQVDVEADVGLDKIRRMIWEEMLLYHPEAAFH